MSEKKQPQRLAKLESSGHVLQGLFEDGKSPLSKPFLRWKLWRSWESVVGPTVAKACEPVSYDRGLIWIWVANSTWIQELQFLKPELLRKINHWAQTDFVSDIKFTLNRREIPDDMFERRELDQAIENLQSIDD